MNTDLTAVDLTSQVLLDPAVVDDPYPLYRTLLEQAPVWQVPDTTVFVVSSFAATTEAARRVEDLSSNLRNLVYRGETGAPELLPFGDGDSDVLATADPPVHTLHRGTVFPELVARRMRELRGEVAEIADAHIEPAVAAGRFDAMSAIANAVPIRVVSRLIGFQDEDPETLLLAAFESTTLVSASLALDAMTSSMEHTMEVNAWIDQQLQQAIQQGGDGILGVVAKAVTDGTLEHHAGVVIMQTLLSAGGESTTSLLGNAIHILATRSDLQDRLRDDPSLVVPFVEEVLRVESPFRHHLRHAVRTTELAGVTIPAGSTVLLLWAAANRDPEEYDRPDEILLDRPSARHHLGFGRGIHLCVGAPLARLEAEVVLTALLASTSSIGLDAENPPTRVNSLMVRRFETLPVVAAPSA